MHELSSLGLGLLALNLFAWGLESEALQSEVAGVNAASSAAASRSLLPGGEESTTAYCADHTPPVVTVTAPLKGKVVGGTSLVIRWRSADLCDDGSAGALAAHHIRLSYTGVAPFDIVIAKDLPGTDRSYTWTVPCTDATAAAIRVKAVDKAGNEGLAYSDQFEINKGASCFPPPPDPCDGTRCPCIGPICPR